MSEIKKVVLAYSGGLDTSIIIPWLKENYNNPEIIAVAADVGQGDELEGLEEKAIKTGASKLYIEDLTDEMVDALVVAGDPAHYRKRIQEYRDAGVDMPIIFEAMGTCSPGQSLEMIETYLMD